MKTVPSNLKIRDILSLKSQQMLIVNPEYQRGVVWNINQKRRLVDSVLRGYPIPLIYFHHIKQEAGGLTSERFEVIDGQQRINALSEFHEGAFKLFDPVKDAQEARFPDFLKRQPCPWGRLAFSDLDVSSRETFLDTVLPIVRIETHNPNEARDLFVRLQAGMPLNSQEKRDAWPGQFTDYVLRLGGKAGIARYPGHDFFNALLGARKSADRGKFRQLAAQIAILFLTRRQTKSAEFADINAAAIDDFYYENLDFDALSEDAKRVIQIFDRVTHLLGDKKRSKVLGHEAIHLVLLVDALLDDYTRSWEERFALAFDEFRQELAKGKTTSNDAVPNEYWLRYGVLTRVNSDRGDVIKRRHEFFSAKMRAILLPQPKDPMRIFGQLERELIYYRDQKKCGECGADVLWDDAEFHHIIEHSKGGVSVVDNGALVHKDCHPKTETAVKAFAAKWEKRAAVKELDTLLS